MYSLFHFAHDAWLWGLLVIPATIALYALFFRPSVSRSRLERFADRHLLPHLIAGRSGAPKLGRRFLLLWSLLWACGMVAMAEPRWNYTDLEAFKPEQNLVVLFDLSKSMDAQDVKPSRLVEAREQVEDLIGQARGINIGLVAYAADAHMVSPITDDTKPILDLLPYLNTSLPAVQGNNLKPALAMASRMLAAEPGNNKSILVISDGGFRDNDIAGAVAATVRKDTALYTLGVGTEQGAPIPAGKGGWVTDSDGKMVFSRLQADRLRALSAERGGLYAQASYTDDGIRAILSRIDWQDKAESATGKTVRYWQEHFYILVLVMAALVLPWFRKGVAFPALVLMAALALPSGNAEASDWQRLFLNKPQQAQKIFNKGDYKGAAAAFDTPYRRGVAQYKAGEFASAEKSFAQAHNAAPGARYNLGNAQVMEGKYDDAIASYESVLKREPANRNAKHNLEIAKKLKQLKEQQKQQQDKNSGSDKGKDGQQKDSGQQQSSQGKQQSGKDKENSAQSGSKDQKQQGRNADKEKQENSRQQQASEQGSSGEKESPQQKAASSGSSGSQKPDSGQGNAQGQKSSAKQQENAQQKPSQGQQQARAQSLPSQAQGQQQPQPGQQNQAGAQPAAPKNPAGELNPAAAKENGTAGLEKDNAMAAQQHPRTQRDVDADQWLNRIENDPQSFLKNQFTIETQANGTTQGAEPW